MDNAVQSTSSHASASRATTPAPACASYWNPQLLHTFSLLMAGQGCCVNASLLLCDTAYARQLLRRACTLRDQRLQQVAVDLLASMAHGDGAPHPPAAGRPH